mmetsp:Transcript_2824/g.17576  ORF Transcript_2824/g.17576 Transcript_2824/m.17576 type:complete len:116 (+) Transcript_2824:2951-3298(+)
MTRGLFKFPATKGLFFSEYHKQHNSIGRTRCRLYTSIYRTLSWHSADVSSNVLYSCLDRINESDLVQNTGILVDEDKPDILKAFGEAKENFGQHTVQMLFPTVSAALLQHKSQGS